MGYTLPLHDIQVDIPELVDHEVSIQEVAATEDTLSDRLQQVEEVVVHTQLLLDGGMSAVVEEVAHRHLPISHSHKMELRTESSWDFDVLAGLLKWGMFPLPENFHDMAGMAPVDECEDRN